MQSLGFMVEDLGYSGKHVRLRVRAADGEDKYNVCLKVSVLFTT